MKKITSVVAALLALTALVALLPACAKPGNGNGTTSAPETTGGAVGDETTDIFVADDLPDMDLGQTVTFLYWKDVERPEFYVEESENDGDAVSIRINERNSVVERRLGIKLDWQGINGNYKNQKGFVEAAANSVAAGGGYDVFAGYSMTGATLAMRGLTQNLLELEHLNFEKPWWPKSLTDSATIDGKLYFTSGDISTNLLYMMYASFFNKDFLVEAHPDMKADDMYDLVYNGKWTLDKMIELCQDVYSDENANGTADYADKYGFETIDLHFDAFYIGSELEFLIKNSDGTLTLSDDVASEKTLKLLDKLSRFFYDSGFAYTKGTTSKEQSARAFSEGKMIFTVDRVYLASGGNMRSVDSFTFGLLPVPKYDEEQSDYRTCMAFPYTLYSISVKALDADAAAATLECLASEGYRRVTPALFEQSMKVRYSDNSSDSQMYDLVRKNVVMDLSRIFATPLRNMSCDPFRQTLRENTGSGWKTKVNAMKGVLNSCINEINKTMAGR